MKENLAGKIHISRWTRNKEPHTGITIEIEDEASGSCVLKVDITPESLGNAMVGSSSHPITYSINEKYAGALYEVKEVRVPYSPGYVAREKQPPLKAAALKPFEVDGWSGRESDLGNHHRGGNGIYLVAFGRYVNAETGEPIL